jgi:hypothetical protein
VFESRVFQFTRVPYGFKNSLSAEHLEHLKIVIGKLTSAGFTINAKKCNFCRPEITFLGYVISNGGMETECINLV